MAVALGAVSGSMRARNSAINLNDVRCPAQDQVAVHKQMRHKMQTEIQPKYGEMVATCSCGNVIKTRSTMAKEIHIDVCSECHPFYTGKQKVVDSGGRIDRFNKRFTRRAGK